VVAAAGAVDHKRVVEEVTRRFSSFDGTPAPKPQAAMFGKGGSAWCIANSNRRI